MTDIRDEVAAALHDVFVKGDGAWVDDFYASLAARGLTVVREGELDAKALRQAFINAGIVWLLPASQFDEAVEVVGAEYARLTRQPEGQ